MMKDKDKHENFKVVSCVKKAIKGFRLLLERLREKNPRIFDMVSKFAQAAWVILSSFAVKVTEDTFFIVIIMSCSFSGMLTFQWALLTNRRIRETKKKQDGLKKTYKSRYRNLLLFMHSVAHNIKMQIVNMPYQQNDVSRQQMVTFLIQALNSLEELLTDWYSVKISASVKLCVDNTCLKTYARGKNNTSSRGGRGKVREMNWKKIELRENYAYQAIIEKQLQYFAEGDLEHLCNKFKETDEFFCEYGAAWKKMFKASIVIPIRYPMRGGESDAYKVLGMVCIDAPSVLDEWNKGNESVAYMAVAFFADALYNLMENYMKYQEQELQVWKNK